LQSIAHPSTKVTPEIVVLSYNAELHPENAPSPMLVTLSGIVTLVKPLHPSNAPSPMLVTLSGIVTLVKPLHP
jgi:hypothetical protein